MLWYGAGRTVCPVCVIQGVIYAIWGSEHTEYMQWAGPEPWAESSYSLPDTHLLFQCRNRLVFSDFP